VVRVRRESDNTEKDFSGSQIESGEMARWVNEQPTLPLDLRELDTNTGERDGALIEAAAAYSLRKLKEDFTGDVVEVRRNVDGATKSFTADEVTDGTLENFVKGLEEYSLSTAKNYTTHPFEEFSSPSANGFTALNSSAEAFAGWDIPSGSAGDVVEVSFDINITSGTPRVQLRPEYNDRKIRSNGFETGTSGSYTATLKATGDYSFISFSDGDVPSEFTVSNFKVYNNSTVNELPLDQATGAAAAYSLRNLSSSYTGDVVEVRRSSDDAVQSFTASEVADGTLEDWVNDYQTELSVARNYTSNPYESFTNASSSGFTASNSSGTGFAGFDLSGASGDEVEVSFYLNIRSGSPQIRLRAAYNSSGNSSTGTTYTTNGTKTITLTATADFGFIAFSEGDIPSDFDVSNFQIVSRSADGHVRTWYDQSGSDNHAVQTTPANQPKIVEGGTLLKDSNNNVAVKFDSSSDQYLENASLPSSFTSSNVTFSDFTVQEALQNNVTTTAWGFGSTVSSATRLTKLFHSGGNFGYQGYGSTASYVSAFDAASYSANEVLLSSGVRVGTDLDIFKNSADADMDNSFDTGTINLNTFAIGSYVRSSGSTNPFNGNIAEVIIYDSDQSTKRRAIEENIANHYDISLAAFSRDGTVSTWYDQSGNTNDATQTDPTKQPKIVDSGNLLTDGVTFDQSNETELVVVGDPVITADYTGTYSAFSVQNVSTEESGYLYGNASTDDGTSLYAATVSANSTVPAYNLSDRSSANNSHDRIERSSGENLLSAVYDNQDAGLLVNGGGTMVDESVYDFPSGTQNFVIGNRNGGSISEQYLTGSIKEIVVYNSNQSDNRTAIEANIGETYGITDIPAADDTVNGFVQTWYDQSGNVPANDAVQSAAANQPKIVGEVTSGQPHAFLGAIEFDGSGSFMSASGFAFSPSGDMLISSVQKLSTGQVYDARDGGGDGIFVQQGGSDLRFRYNGDGSVDASGNNDLSLATFEIDGTTMTVYKNGSSAGTDTVVAGLSTTTDFHIGRNSFSVSNYADGKIYEIVAYDSDQSSNRPAIEANILNQYDI
jgi:hypothetical protein